MPSYVQFDVWQPSAGSVTGATVSSAGYINFPNQPKFVATITSSQTYTVSNTNQIMSFNQKIYDANNNYNTSTYAFTAPISGYYMFFWNLYFYNYTPSANGPFDVSLQKNGTYITRTSVGNQPSSGANPETMSAQTMLQLSTGDYINFGVALYGSGTATLYKDGSYLTAPSTSHWGGYLLG